LSQYSSIKQGRGHLFEAWGLFKILADRRHAYSKGYTYLRGGANSRIYSTLKLTLVLGSSNVKLNLDRTSTKHDCLISCFQSYLQMQFVQPALGSEDPYKRKAALIALAVLAEGCADYIRNRLVSLGQFSLDC